LPQLRGCDCAKKACELVMQHEATLDA
jgi:hypothetical protein